jgi:hypothetical protein
VDTNAASLLSEVGKYLDADVYPRVANGGLVVLDRAHVPAIASTESNHGTEKERGSAAGSRQRSAGREGTSGGSRPPRAAAPVIGADPVAQIHEQVSDLQVQYPGAQHWHQEGGVWLLVPVRLMAGLNQHALLTVGIGYATGLVRGWAFWASSAAVPAWIGPRHTNPDGSICAFDASDRAWDWTSPLVTLLDLYTLWIVRQLHVQQFGRWPGKQAVHIAGEMLLELQEDEYCGCRDGTKRYRDCCMPRHLSGNRIRDSLIFFRMLGSRKPPPEVVAFVQRGHTPPPLSMVLPEWPEWLKSPWTSESSSSITCR